MRHIELFAGCGGLSLGLASLDFELLLANELSPMATETFAYNFFDTELSDPEADSSRVLWLNSNFSENKDRLRENPYHYPKIGESGYSDIPENPADLNGKLIVGSIIELNKYLRDTPNALRAIRNSFGEGEIDLVSGGPPCQSFSMAGLRQLECERNTLPWEFAQFVGATHPRFALLENVTGILRPFTDANGKKVYAWYEAAKAFCIQGYAPICLHVNAKYVGVPQNRPRFILLAIRHDIAMTIFRNPEITENDRTILQESLNFYEQVTLRAPEEVNYGLLKYYDVDKDKEHFHDSIFSCLRTHERFISVQQAIQDLKFQQPDEVSNYVQWLNETFAFLTPKAITQNHAPRSNSLVVKRRFRLYQVLAQLGQRAISNEVFTILRGESDSLSDSAWTVIKPFEFEHEDGARGRFESKNGFIKFLQAHPTRKQTQRALIHNLPAPAALSIPDDACHYDSSELRALTVREMARIQSFPDSFVFCSKVTTGGKMRRFEVPQYTQVGNAVPPLLARQLGIAIQQLNRAAVQQDLENTVELEAG